MLRDKLIGALEARIPTLQLTADDAWEIIRRFESAPAALPVPERENQEAGREQKLAVVEETRTVNVVTYFGDYASAILEDSNVVHIYQDGDMETFCGLAARLSYGTPCEDCFLDCQEVRRDVVSRLPVPEERPAGDERFYQADCGHGPVLGDARGVSVEAGEWEQLARGFSERLWAIERHVEQAVQIPAHNRNVISFLARRTTDEILRLARLSEPRFSIPRLGISETDESYAARLASTTQPEVAPKRLPEGNDAPTVVSDLSPVGAPSGSTSSLQTHCINGHEFTPENTYLRARGGRGCRACHREDWLDCDPIGEVVSGKPAAASSGAVTGPVDGSDSTGPGSTQAALPLPELPEFGAGGGPSRVPSSGHAGQDDERGGGVSGASKVGRSGGETL